MTSELVLLRLGESRHRRHLWAGCQPLAMLTVLLVSNILESGVEQTRLLI